MSSKPNYSRQKSSNKKKYMFNKSKLIKKS